MLPKVTRSQHTQMNHQPQQVLCQGFPDRGQNQHAPACPTAHTCTSKPKGLVQPGEVAGLAGVVATMGMEMVLA